MKTKVLFGLISMVLFAFLAAPSVVAQKDDKGDAQPEVGFRTIDSNCGVPAGDYGWFSAFDWWFAIYSNGRAVLKCQTRLNPDQTPPATTVTYQPGGLCGTPLGSTSDYYSMVDPDGRVTLICRIRF